MSIRDKASFAEASNNESLVNTLPQLESNVQLDSLPLCWLPKAAAVQTESKSLWQNFKDWLRDVFSVNSAPG